MSSTKDKKAKPVAKSKAATKSTVSAKVSSTKEASATSSNVGAADVALTVRVEVNLPADADQDTYDRIFKSIRENLINGG